MREEPLSDKKLNDADSKYTLVLFNDDHNTFDHVIEALVEICGHDPTQAEQCALITHHKGRCEVKTGRQRVLISMNKRLSERDLTSEVI